MESNRGRQIDIVEQAERIVSAYIEHYFAYEQQNDSEKRGAKRMRTGYINSRRAVRRLIIAAVIGVAVIAVVLIGMRL